MMTTAPDPAARDLPPGTLLRHYKGGLYRVTGFCRIEATGETGVLYQPLQGEAGVTWMRPLAQFGDEVATAAGTVRRFTVVPPGQG